MDALLPFFFMVRLFRQKCKSSRRQVLLVFSIGVYYNIDRFFEGVAAMDQRVNNDIAAYLLPG